MRKLAVLTAALALVVSLPGCDKATPTAPMPPGTVDQLHSKWDYGFCDDAYEVHDEYYLDCLNEFVHLEGEAAEYCDLLTIPGTWNEIFHNSVSYLPDIRLIGPTSGAWRLVSQLPARSWPNGEGRYRRKVKWQNEATGDQMFVWYQFASPTRCVLLPSNAG